MSNGKQERIVCAAVRFERGHERTGVENNVNVLCVNYEDDVITNSRDEFERSLYVVVNREIKGFITNKNRFVDPKEAMGIAIGAGQILYLNELLDAYINDVIGSRVISPQARMILNAWEHQRKMAECRELKPEDLY